jgi:hypothetical protein
MADGSFEMLSSSILSLAELDLGSGSWTRVALLVLIGAMVATLGALLIYVARARRRVPQITVHRVVPPQPPPMPSNIVRRASSMSASRRSGPASGSTSSTSGGSSGGLAVAVTPPSRPGSSGAGAGTGGPVGCPACRREFDASVRFCPYDSRRLVPAAELLERSRSAGSICPRCRRAYDAGIRYCPHDAEELMPMALWEATRGKKHDAAPTGVLAKICPQCANRYDLATTFCGKDGAELVTIN